jgi:predicted membrane-bound spermidine synthase
MLSLLYTVFVLSGAAGLMYESIWARYLGLFVGHSAYAQVIVLVIFMGGMSIGALVAGERSSRLRSPLLWYAGIELAAGVIGLLFHDAFLAMTSLGYDRIFPALGAGSTEVIVKWIMAALLILPQSILLGATFPLMSAGVIRIAPDRGGQSLALLYFSNSLGASAGVIISGFYLVALAGLPGTLVIAAMLNIIVALVVFLAARRWPEPSVQAAQFTVVDAPVVRDAAPTRLLLVVAFGTAVASFIYEIAWVRMLSLVLGSATHSFELMLSAFILGLSLGALWIRRRVDGGSVRLLAVVQLAMGALAIATLPVYLASFDWMASAMSMFAHTDQGYQALSVFRYGLCLAVMLPATFCAGMTLPVITRLLLSAGAGERSVGRVYGVNTLGAILGVTLASLVLMPVLGLKWLLVLGGCVDLLLGVLLLSADWRSHPWRATRRTLASAAAVATALLVVLNRATFDTGLLTSGVFRYGTVQAPGTANVLSYRDGRTASVSVRRIRATGGLSLATNGKPDASLGPEWLRPLRANEQRGPFTHNASTQTLTALIPLAYMANAREAAVIGQGSGMSSHVLLGSPELHRAVTIEIEPEMIRASRLFYPANRRVFDDPRSSFAIDDARSYFAAGHQMYDLIIAEPSNPWVAGVSGLFTTEFYRSIKRYLRDDGILGQWLQISEIDDGLVLSVVAALAQNFPSYAIYAISDHDIMIVASKRSTLPAPDWTIARRYPGLVEDLARVTPMTAHTFETLRLADNRSLAPLAKQASANSDFYPVLDLNAERARFNKREAVGFAWLGAERFSVSLALSGVRTGFGDVTQAAIAGVPRLEAAVLSAALRARKSEPRDVALMQSAFRNQVLRQSIAGGVAPVDWRAWVALVSLMDGEVHGGAAGVPDSSFYGEVDRYLRRTAPPAEARAAVNFLRALSSWDFVAAKHASEPLVARALIGDPWLDPDLLRDGTTTAYLMSGDRLKAREIFVSLAPFSRRAAADLRNLLLQAQVSATASP